jgi:glycosyltransferase involved in cell wall biosynthesis
VSDDGSTDNTLDIVAQFAEQVGQQVTVLTGPCQGSSTRNFFHLIQHAQVKDPSDLFAFCDQDDVWFEDKLERAVAWHANNIDKPVRLYCGRTQFVNEKLKPIGLSPSIKRPPSFGNALVQNIASGNTMVMSSSVLLVLKKVAPEHSVWHDWTAYLVTTATGGQVWFDSMPNQFYRQHRDNVLGSNAGLRSLIIGYKQSIFGRYQKRLTINLNALQDILQFVDKSAVLTIDRMLAIRLGKYSIQRVVILKKSAIRRQTKFSNLSLLIAAFFGQI